MLRQYSYVFELIVFKNVHEFHLNSVYTHPQKKWYMGSVASDKTKARKQCFLFPAWKLLHSEGQCIPNPFLVVSCKVLVVGAKFGGLQTVSGLQLIYIDICYIYIVISDYWGNHLHLSFMLQFINVTKKIACELIVLMLFQNSQEIFVNIIIFHNKPFTWIDL